MVDEAKRPTVTVNCGISMGVRLNTHDPHDAQTHELRPGSNTLDKEFWDKWLAANSQSPLVTSNQISVLAEEDKDRADPWAERGV